MAETVYISDDSFAKASATAHKMALDADKNQCVSLVYFIAPIEGGPIKIGVTRDMRGRLTTIQNNSPVQLDLIACAPGGRDLEGFYHAMFINERLHGEWFEPSERLLGECAKLANRWIG